MTDEELAAIKAYAISLHVLIDHEPDWRDLREQWQVFSKLLETQQDRKTLLRHVEALLAEVEAWREIGRAVTVMDTDDGYDGAYKCHWCDAMYDGVGDAPTRHTADCLVTKARELLGLE